MSDELETPTTPEGQLALLGETLKAEWFKTARLQRDKENLQARVKNLERMHRNNQAHIAKLEARLTPQAIAERIFKETGG